MLDNREFSDGKESIQTELIWKNVPTVIAFGGINEGMGMPPFEFFKLLNNVKVNKVFVRDKQQAWYQLGLDQFLQSPTEVAEQIIQAITLEHNNPRLIMIGNSMGGYAAMLFGLMLNAEQVIAFSPQTFVDRLNRMRFLDFRWAPQINRMHTAIKQDEASTAHFDLRPLISKNVYKPRIDVYYSERHRLDRIHAERLRECKNVFLYPCRANSHALVRELRDEGKLSEIILRSISDLRVD